MEIKLIVTIPDEVFIDDMQRPTEEEWQNLISRHIESMLERTEARAKREVQQSPADLAKQSEEADEQFKKALDTLSNAVLARRKMNSPGVQVQVHRD